MKKRILSYDLDSSLIGKKVILDIVPGYYGLVTVIDYVKNHIRVSWYRISDNRDMTTSQWVDISRSPIYFYKEKKQPNYVFDF